MRKFLLMSAAALGLAAGPVLAQTAPATPPGASPPLPDTAAPGASGMTGIRSMRGQAHETARPYHAKPASVKRGRAGSARHAAAGQAPDAGVGALRTRDDHGGVGFPSSS